MKFIRFFRDFFFFLIMKMLCKTTSKAKKKTSSLAERLIEIFLSPRRLVIPLNLIKKRSLEPFRKGHFT